jgi:integrin beta 3
MLNSGSSEPENVPLAAGPTAPPAPRLANRDAMAGTVLVDGTYRCYLLKDPANPNGGMEPVGAVLVVPRANGQYTWEGKPGTYEMTRSGLSSQTSIIGDVSFTSGPLQNAKAQSIATFPNASSAIATRDTLKFQDNDRRFCAFGD